jgi:predicted lipoprotein
MKHTIKLGLASAIAVAMLTGCGGGSGGDSAPKVSDLTDNAANKALVNNITDTVIVAGYTTLHAKVGALADALEVLENDQTQARLSSAQTAWKAARVPWESGEGHIFGPIDTQGVDPASDSWPVIKSDLDGSLGGWAVGDSTDAFADEVRGFHAIEYILFGDGSTTNTRNIADLSNKQIAYAHALGESMEKQMKILLDAWNGGYTTTFKALSPAAAAEELLGGLTGIADEVGNGKMGDPYNDKDTTLVESQFSWNSTTDFANNITSMKSVWDAGMDDLVAQIDSDKATEIGTQITQAIKEIKAVSDADGDGEIDANVKAKAYRNQINDAAGRVLIKKAIDTLAALQANLESLAP